VNVVWWRLIACFRANLWRAGELIIVAGLVNHHGFVIDMLDTAPLALRTNQTG
jgi:hypothetical protein